MTRTEYEHDDLGRAIKFKLFDDDGNLIKIREKRGDTWVTVYETDPSLARGDPTPGFGEITQIETRDDEGTTGRVEFYEEGKGVGSKDTPTGVLTQTLDYEPSKTREGIISIGRGGTTTKVPVDVSTTFYEGGNATQTIKNIEDVIYIHDRRVPKNLQEIARPNYMKTPLKDDKQITVSHDLVASAQTKYNKMNLLNKVSYHAAAFGSSGTQYLTSYLPGGWSPQKFANVEYALNVLSPDKPSFSEFAVRGMMSNPFAIAAVAYGGSALAGGTVNLLGSVPVIKTAATTVVGGVTKIIPSGVIKLAVPAVVYGGVGKRGLDTYTTFKADSDFSDRAFELATAQVANELLFTYSATKGFKYGMEHGFPVKYAEVELQTPPIYSGEKYHRSKWRGIYFQSGSDSKVLGGIIDGQFSFGKPSFTIQNPTLPFSPIEYEIMKGPISEYYQSADIPGQALIKWEIGADLTRNIGSPKFAPKMQFSDVLKQTKYVSEAADDLAIYFQKNPDITVYGSTVQKMYQGESLDRLLADVDIQSPKADAHLDNLLNMMKKYYGDSVRLAPLHERLIEVKIGEKWHHAIDLHLGDIDDIGYSPASQNWIGLGIAPRGNIVVDKITTMQFPEQVQRKGISITTPGISGVGPPPHRIKDVSDFISGQTFILETYPDPSKTAKLEILKTAWGVEIVAPPSAEMFVYSPGVAYPSSSPPVVFPSPTLISSPNISPSPLLTISPSISSPGISPSPQVSKSPSLKLSPSISSPSFSITFKPIKPRTSPSLSLPLKSVSIPSRVISPKPISPSIAFSLPASISPPRSPSKTKKDFDSLFKMSFGITPSRKKKKKSKRSKKSSTKYKPSLIATYFDIKGKRPLKLTGLEIRPRGRKK